MAGRRWLAGAGAAIVGLVAIGALSVVAGTALWRRETRNSVSGLAEASRLPDPAAFGDHAFARLPPPVARYFAFALPDPQRRIERVRIRWTGEFRMRPDAAWAPFTATQHFTSRPPGFVWDAEIRMMPLVPVRVRDSYAQSDASMMARVGALLPVVDQSGSPELAQSALARWLGEAVWFPSALLPDAGDGGVQWTGVDDSTARVTVTDGETSASAEFRFAPGGEIVAMSALRFRDADGEAVLTPFEGQYFDYAPRDGFMVPTRAEVAWLLPGGRFAYWRGGPAGVEYTFGMDAPR